MHHLLGQDVAIAAQTLVRAVSVSREPASAATASAATASAVAAAAATARPSTTVAALELIQERTTEESLVTGSGSNRVPVRVAASLRMGHLKCQR